MTISPVALAIIILLICLFFKVPVFVSIMAGCVTYFSLTPGIPQLIVTQRIVSGTESIPLLAVPFFVCAGVYMNYSGVTERIMNFCSVVTGRMTGGLAQVNVLLSTLMGGLSGSNLADAAMEAKMLVPEMEKKGFSKAFSSVVTATSAMITPLIPPGIGMIIYASVTGVSVGKMFISGLGVGAILCIAMMILVHIVSKKRGYKPIRTEKLPAREVVGSVKQAFFPLCLPIIIIGGIRIGMFTPTEAGAVAIVYSLILGFCYRKVNVKNLIAGIKETVLTTASIMLTHISNKYLFLLIVNVFLIFVGMFVEGNAINIILGPLLAPIAASYGIDPIQFGMMFIFNISIGSLSPPMGTLMFVTCGVTKCKIKDFIKESVPFYVLLFIVLALLTFVPVCTTGLVNLFY